MWHPKHPPTGILALILVVLLAAGCSKAMRPAVPPATEDALLIADPAHPNFLARLDFTGSVVRLDRSGKPQLLRNQHFFVHVDGPPPGPFPVVSDTIPEDAVLKGVHWRGAATGDTLRIVDDAPDFGHGPGRNADGTYTVGVHILRLQVPARLGGGEAVVAFQVGFPPERAWWAGPDPARFPPSSDGDGRAVDVVTWSQFRTSPAWPPDGRGFFGPDSFAFRPLDRTPPADGRRTFYEIFGDRIYARSEGDTVHFGAWLVFVNGGFDRDSRYAPRVVPATPGLPAGFESQPDPYRLLIPAGLVGSPIGFRLRVQVRVPGFPGPTQPSESTTYPVFDAFSVFHHPQVAGYWAMTFPGKAYATAYPVDAVGLVGRPGVPDLVDLADRVDAGGGTPEERELRSRVLTFYVRGGAPVGPD